MRVLERTVRTALVCGVFGTAAVGAMASGCGGDDSGTPGPVEGGSADQTVDTSSEGSTTDASQQEAAQRDNAQPDSSMADGSPQGDGSPNDVQQDVAQDTQGSDRADTGGDSAEAAATMGDASDGGACVTSAAQLAAADGVEAGVADGGSLAPAVVFSFDSPGGIDIAWGAFTNTSQSSAVFGQTLADGYPCPGALEFTLTYSGFAGNSDVAYTFTNGPGAQNWTGRTNLHMWLKLVTSNYSLVAAVQVTLKSHAFGLNLYKYLPASTTFASQGAHQGWIEAVIPLTPSIPDTGTGGFDPADVDYLEFQVQAPGPQVDGGPAAPSPTTLLVDSIWLE